MFTVKYSPCISDPHKCKAYLNARTIILAWLLGYELHSPNYLHHTHIHIGSLIQVFFSSHFQAIMHTTFILILQVLGVVVTFQLPGVVATF